MKHIGIKIALVFCFFFVSGGKVSEASENKLSFTPIVKQTEEKLGNL